MHFAAASRISSLKMRQLDVHHINCSLDLKAKELLHCYKWLEGVASIAHNLPDRQQGKLVFSEARVRAVNGGVAGAAAWLVCRVNV